jgi:N-methylhydantoinase B
MRSAGGGGWGEPSRRAPALVARDVKDGIVSREAARLIYRVALDEEGRVDPVETGRLRALT